MRQKKVYLARLVRWSSQLLIALLLFTVPVKAQKMQVTDTDRTAIRSVIEQQLAALRRDDADGAFAFASPGIRTQFGTAKNFLAMVRASYQPVYRPRSVVFEDITSVEGIPTQQVLLLSPDGEPVRALYLMEKQSDGTWKINGCYLVPIKGETI